MDDWDFMEFSEISDLLKSEKVDAGISKPVWNSNSDIEFGSRKNEPESCSSLIDESPTSSPTSDLENIGASEHSPQITDGKFLNLRAYSLSSGNNVDETFVSFSQGPVVCNPTSTSTSSTDLPAKKFVQFTDVNQLRPSLISSSRSFGKVNGETVVRFLGGSVVQKATSVSTIPEVENGQSTFQTSDKHQLLQRSILVPPSSGVNMRHDEKSSDVRGMIKQNRILFPRSSVSITSQHYGQLLGEDQRVMKSSASFPPSHEEEMALNKHSRLRSNETSGIKEVKAQNQTLYHTTGMRKEFPIGYVPLGRTINKQVVKLPDVMEDTTTEVEAQISVKCRSRSKPGFSTNPRSLTEKTRRKRINERLKELQELVPKSVKGDNIVDMLDQAITYVGTLENQLQVLVMRKGNRRIIHSNFMS